MARLAGVVMASRRARRSRPRVPVGIALLLLVGSAPDAAAQAAGTSHRVAVPSVSAIERTGPISLDGRLDEPFWSGAPAATDFRQSEPVEGAAATQRTEVRFVYDDEALYVGARMHDEEGAAGVRSRLVRRDRRSPSDELELIFDTFHDHLGRTVIGITPSGVKRDAYGPGGADTDESWDPVWQAATAIDSLGWTAELRIPFSQLRYPRSAVQVWGLQIFRETTRLNEESQWAFWGLSESGGPSRFGHLEGIRPPASRRHVELVPYVVARSAHVRAADEEDPFHEAEVTDFRLGADLKYLLTSNLTLDATINPDFGQVEVDPAVVNLSAFETFFPERRPFFIAGSGLFAFGGVNCFFCSNSSPLSLFYSRRIGRRPQGADLVDDLGEHADVPENTSIVAAAKITGRTAGGWSLGLLDAVTPRETAALALADGARLTQEVEPRSNYLVGRVKRDLLDGDLVLGGIFTSVLRAIEDSALATRLSRHAESVGLDGEYWWAGRTYRLKASAAISQVSGDTGAIGLLQRSSARYFDRPDRQSGGNGLLSDAYDPAATHLRGVGLYTRIAKESGRWLWEAATNVRSPGFETNDIAFLTRADYVWMNANLARQYTTPTAYYRQLMVTGGAQQQFNFDGDRTDLQLHASVGGDLPNYWDVHTFFLHRPSVLDDRLLRGGPVVRRPGTNQASISVSTDSRRAVELEVDPSVAWNDEGAVSYDVEVEVTYKPASNVSISLGPAFSRSVSSSQYVTSEEDATAEHFYGRRYVLSDLVQHTVSMDTRLNVTFTPTLSLEIFAQPFISSANFANFKEFVAPRSAETRVFGRDVGTITAEGSGSDRRLVIDPDGSGAAPPLSFDDPDFNARSLRGNAVLRWEYLPGSTLFLVWTQDRADEAPIGSLDFARSRDALFSAHPDNIFLLKVNYWLGF